MLSLKETSPAKIMTRTDIKGEIKRLLENESDEGVLEKILRMLSRRLTTQSHQERVVEGALLSEEDIQAGRLLDQDEMIKRTTQ
jgi:hypothetical protein